MGEGRGDRIDSQVSPRLLSGAAVALGVLLQFTNGSVPPGLMSRAMAGLAVAVILTVAGSVVVTRGRIANEDGRTITRFLGVALLIQLALFFTKRPALFLPIDDRSWVLPFAIGLSIVAVAAWLAIGDWSRYGRWLIPAAVVVFVLLGGWIVRHTPDPGIDVYTFQREGLRAISHGANPYAITMPQVYGNPEYYGEGLVQNGQLLIGLPYPPLSLLLEWPVYLMAGDYRYALLLALAGAAVLLARSTRSVSGSLAAILLLFTPRSYFVAEQGWTEPFVVLALAGVMYSAIRKPSWLPVALGLLFAMKQYAIFLAPIVFFLLPGFDWRRVIGVLAKAAAIALAITLPFVLWSPNGFYRSVVLFQFLQPFRADSLSYLAWFARVSGSTPPVWVGFVMMFAAMIVMGLKAPRTAAGFAAGGALILLAFFAFNKQAFCNYYFVVVGALWCAVGAARSTIAE